MDPFFQYIKNNKNVREILLSENEYFSPEKIIELAIQQPVQKDQSTALPQKRYIDPSKMTFEQRFRHEHDRPIKSEYIKPELYYAPERGINTDDYRGKKIHLKKRCILI